MITKTLTSIHNASSDYLNVQKNIENKQYGRVAGKIASYVLSAGLLPLVALVIKAVGSLFAKKAHNSNAFTPRKLARTTRWPNLGTAEGRPVFTRSQSSNALQLGTARAGTAQARSTPAPTTPPAPVAAPTATTTSVAANVRPEQKKEAGLAALFSNLAEIAG